MGKPFIFTGINPEELPELTVNEQRFLELILKGLSGTKAYRQAFNSAATESSCWCEASKLRNSPKIGQWMTAAKIAHLGKATLSLDEHMQNLDRLQEIAIRSGNVSAAVMTEQIKGKAAGLHIDRVQEVPIGSEDALAELAKANPALAKQLAEQAGIALEEPKIH